MLIDKTLEELDGIDWGEPEYLSGLVINCHRVRRVPLKDFIDDDLRRMIGQKFSLDWLVPIALARLLDEPFAGDMYAGDLMHTVIQLPADFWQGHPDLAKSLSIAAAKALRELAGDAKRHGEVGQEVVNLLQNYRHS